MPTGPLPSEAFWTDPKRGDQSRNARAHITTSDPREPQDPPVPVGECGFGLPDCFHHDLDQQLKVGDQIDGLSGLSRSTKTAMR